MMNEMYRERKSTILRRAAGLTIKIDRIVKLPDRFRFRFLFLLFWRRSLGHVSAFGFDRKKSAGYCRYQGDNAVHRSG